MKPFTQTADTLDQELADKIDGILAAHGEDPTQLVGILLDEYLRTLRREE